MLPKKVVTKCSKHDNGASRNGVSGDFEPSIAGERRSHVICLLESRAISGSALSPRTDFPATPAHQDETTSGQTRPPFHHHPLRHNDGHRLSPLRPRQSVDRAELIAMIGFDKKNQGYARVVASAISTSERPPKQNKAPFKSPNKPPYVKNATLITTSPPKSEPHCKSLLPRRSPGRHGPPTPKPRYPD
jgi:hypothetical protein